MTYFGDQGPSLLAVRICSQQFHSIAGHRNTGRIFATGSSHPAYSYNNHLVPNFLSIYHIIHRNRCSESHDAAVSGRN